jgi:hypothetical protein
MFLPFSPNIQSEIHGTCTKVQGSRQLLIFVKNINYFIHVRTFRWIKCVYVSFNVGLVYESFNVGLVYESFNVGLVYQSFNVGLVYESFNVGLVYESFNVGLVYESFNVGFTNLLMLA